MPRPKPFEHADLSETSMGKAKQYYNAARHYKMELALQELMVIVETKTVGLHKVMAEGRINKMRVEFGI